MLEAILAYIHESKPNTRVTFSEHVRAANAKPCSLRKIPVDGFDSHKEYAHAPTATVERFGLGRPLLLPESKDPARQLFRTRTANGLNFYLT